MNERCAYCGRQVGLGSGNFVNRVPLETSEDREGLVYPEGDFKCATCDRDDDTGYTVYVSKDTYIHPWTGEILVQEGMEVTITDAYAVSDAGMTLVSVALHFQNEREFLERSREVQIRGTYRRRIIR